MPNGGLEAANTRLQAAGHAPAALSAPPGLPSRTAEARPRATNRPKAGVVVSGQPAVAGFLRADGRTRTRDAFITRSSRGAPIWLDKAKVEPRTVSPAGVVSAESGAY